MKVLLFEQFHGGHYFNYLNCLIPAIRPLCDELVVATTATASQAAGAPRLTLPEALSASVSWEIGVPEVSPGLDARARMASAQSLAWMMSRHQPDHTLVPSADSVGLGFALPRPVGWRRWARPLTAELTFHYGYGSSAITGKQRIKEFVYQSMYRWQNVSRMNFVNFQYYEDFLRKFPALRGRVSLVGDPVPQPRLIGREAARRLLGIPQDGRYIGMLGGLDPRKAVPELLAAFRAAGLPASDRLLLAGRMAPQYAEYIAHNHADLVAQGRLIVINRYLSADELQHGFEALDVAAPVYYDFPGLASLALKALAAQRPVVSHDLGWSGALVRRFGVGHLTDIHDPAHFARTIRLALDTSSDYRPNAATERLMAFHQPENFVRRMTAGLAERYGREELAAQSHDWGWVLQAL